jgi:hypothetical protein
MRSVSIRYPVLFRFSLKSLIVSVWVVKHFFHGPKDLCGSIVIVSLARLGFVPIALSMSALPFLVIRSSFAVAIVIGRIGLALFDFLVPFSMIYSLMVWLGDQQKKYGF